MSGTVVKTVITAKASAELSKQVEEELKLLDPSPEVAIAKLRKPSNASDNSHERERED